MATRLYPVSDASGVTASEYTYRSANPNSANSEQLTSADSSTLSTGNIDFTLGVLVRLTTLQDCVIVGKLSSLSTAANLEYVIWYDNTATAFKFAVSDGSTITTVTSTAGAPSADTWYHIFAWHDASGNTINISIDNGTADSTAHTTGAQDSTETFRCFSDGTANYLSGRANFVALWKRVVSSGDRTSIYRDSYIKNYSELTTAEKTNLVAWWNLDESSGNRTDSVASIVLTDVNTVASSVASRNGSWDFVTGNTVRTLERSTGSSAITSMGGSVGSQGTNTSDSSYMYISAPLSAQTIAVGTFKGQMYCAESNGLANLCRAITVHLVSNDGSTYKALICANLTQTLTSEFSTSIINRNFPPSTNTYEVTVDEGDRILITTGVMKHTSSTSTRNYNMRAGNDQSTDAPEDETDSNYDTRNPWFEFSQDITFQSSFIPRLCLLGVG